MPKLDGLRVAIASRHHAPHEITRAELAALEVWARLDPASRKSVLELFDPNDTGLFYSDQTIRRAVEAACAILGAEAEIELWPEP